MSGRPLIVVSVGTDHHRFDRLVGWVETWAARHADHAEVVVQHGTSRAPSAGVGRDYLGHDELQALLGRAVAVVAHGGPGTILEARRHGVLPLVVPRRPDLDEHVDGHQLDYSARGAADGTILLVEDEQQLHGLLDRAIADPGAFRLADGDRSAASLAARRFGRLADQLLTPPAPAPRIPVLFVAGVGRSGTTLLDRLLGQVPALESVGEVVHLWLRGLTENNLCGCGEPFLTCPYWNAVGEAAFGGWDRLDPDEVNRLQLSVDRHRYLPLMLAPGISPRYAADLRRFSEVLEQLYRAMLDTSDRRMIVDSSKYVSYVYLLRRMPVFDLKVVHLVRDSRGVSYSWTKSVRRPEVVDGEVFMPTYHPGRMAMRWALYNLAYDALPRLGVPTIRVRYDELVADPHGQLDRILDFAGIPSPERSLEFVHDGAVDLAPTHSCSGNPMRFDVGKVRLKLDTDWVRAMPASERALVTALTAPSLRRYGFPVRGADVA